MGRNILSPVERKFVTDSWLGGIEIDATIVAIWQARGLASREEKLAVIPEIRARYLELDMIDIQQELALRFLPFNREDWQ
jgi:hypothetical protein